MFKKQDGSMSNVLKAIATSAGIARALKALVDHFKLDEKEVMDIFQKEFLKGMEEFMEMVKKS